ncbi:polyphosphate kinase 1 [Compostibacter hankyongensis]|uniref:Polyphosphate kinase n=1 Tax=Compostibacter hankyongensis TaxID=1007089 RepID=A0ABP8FKR7_9BACT
MAHQTRTTIVRDISWLSFNARVLQEAKDASVPLHERIRFLGIFSNNLDEFFRVRVATLKRMAVFGKTARMHLEHNPVQILEDIQQTVIRQQQEFSKIWKQIVQELRQEKIYLRQEGHLTRRQQQFILDYFNEEIRSNIIPLMIESIPAFPHLRDKSIYLATVLAKKDQSVRQAYALIEIPTDVFPRFILLPSQRGERNVILLEDVIRFCLPTLFSYFGYDQFSAHVIKVTRDAELDIDNDIATNLIPEMEKALKNRKKGKPVRFIYDRNISPHLLEYLIRRMNLTRKDNLIPGDRIHNFKDFMDFPEQVFGSGQTSARRKSFVHPLLANTASIQQVIREQDVLLSFPYHTFNSIVDLLREAAIDPHVVSIKITAYRLARRSKVINALINAVRNGKQVTVVLELRARFDEEANLQWKTRLEEEGVRVFIGIPHMKVHAKICVIKKRVDGKTLQYGFVSTGNLNEKTAAYYCDHCLLTARRNIMADINRIFSYVEHPGHPQHYLHDCKTLLVSPYNIRKYFQKAIDKEIKAAKQGKPALIILKLNSLSDEKLIQKLYEAAASGVEIRLIVRGICCAYTQHKKQEYNIHAVSIVDEYLEHSRIFYFHNEGHSRCYISSADWMVRNLDHRVEVVVPVAHPESKQELYDILNTQLADNTKARLLDNKQQNDYFRSKGKMIRSQEDTYRLLKQKKYLL